MVVDGDCSHEIKRCLLLGRKPRQHIKMQRQYFTDKALVRAVIFPVVLFESEIWTIKRAEH